MMWIAIKKVAKHVLFVLYLQANGKLMDREEMISTLSLQQEIQKQHAALVAPSTIHTSTTTSMSDTFSKHAAVTDEDFQPSSSKRRKTTHDIPEPKQDVWEFYAD